MASKFNIKSVHKDGKSELTIGIDKNSKTLDCIDDSIIIKNEDGSPAKISQENIPCIPENASETNKLVTQDDLKKMMKNIKDIIESATSLAEILGMDTDNISFEDKEE